MREKDRREQNNPARKFIPNGKQEEFIKLFGADKLFVSMFCAANGVGKSAVGALILTNIVYGPQNEWFKHPIFEKWPYIKRARIVSDPNTIKTKIIPELEKWFPVNEVKRFPEANYEMGKEGKNYICKIETNTGWIIDIMSTEQDAKEFESTDLGFVWIDEPMPKDKFNATIARARLGMVLIWTFTPLTYSAWIKEWMDEHADGEYADYVEAELEDNCKVHGKRGILEHIHIKRMVDAFPEDEKLARAFGRFGHLIGRIHKSFRRKVHVVQPFPVDEKKYSTYMALDPHPRVADHVLWISVDKYGRKYLSGELLSEGSAKLLYERIKAFESAMHYRIEGRIIDPSAFVDDQHKEEASVGKQLFDLGMTGLIKGSKDLMAGIKATNDALHYEMKDGMLVMPPELYFFDTCTVAIKQIEEYVWQEWKGSAKDDKKLNAHPRDRDDHMPENLHRLLLHNLTFIPYQMSLPGNRQTWEDELKELDPYN